MPYDYNSNSRSNSGDYCCVVCQDVVVDNRSCMFCHAMFCRECIVKWVRSKQSCPCCRSFQSWWGGQLRHIEDWQKQADSMERDCDRKCGGRMTWTEREHHYTRECANSLIDCPSVGCESRVLRCHMYRHMKFCKYRELIGSASGSLEESCESVPESILSEESGTSGDSIVHHVTASDTLAGLSVMYGVSKGAIMRYNRLPNENIIAYSKLVIPKDTPIEAKKSSSRSRACRGSQTRKKPTSSLWNLVKSAF